MRASTARRNARYVPGEPPVACAADRVFLFTDLHLDAQRPEECASFVEELRRLLPRASAAAVVVMGDLFDAYSGAEDWELPAFAVVREALLELSATGARVILLRGNRDVMLETSASPDSEAIEVQDSVLCRLPGREPVLLTHGDAFCLADRRYQVLRRTLRRPGLRRFLQNRGIGFRRWLASRLRGVSRGEVARKPLANLDVNSEAVVHELKAHQATQAVIGHLHQRRTVALAGGRLLRILPAWDPESPAWELASILDGAF